MNSKQLLGGTGKVTNWVQILITSSICVRVVYPSNGSGELLAKYPDTVHGRKTGSAPIYGYRRLSQINRAMRKHLCGSHVKIQTVHSNCTCNRQITL